MSRLYMMVTITDRNRKKKFEEFYKKNEHMVFFTTLGRGTANEVRCWTISGLEESEKGRNSIGGNRRNVEETKAGNDCKDADRCAGNRNCIYRATQQHRRRKNITFPDTRAKEI